MTRLVRVELARFFARVLLWCVAVGLVLVSGLIVVEAWRSSAPPSEAQIAEAQGYYQDNLADWQANHEQYEADCLEQIQQAKDNGDDTTGWTCDNPAPTLENFINANPPFAEQGANKLSALAIPLVLGPSLMAVSFIAAEFATGAISNWLTFAPRRNRVYWSKVVAAVLGVVPAVLVATAVAAVGIWLAYRSHGTIGDLGPHGYRPYVDTSLRLVALGLGFAAGAAALAFLLRHTAAVLGVVIGWAVVWEGVIGSAIAGMRPYTLTFDIAAWVQGGASYYVEECTRQDGGEVSCVGVEQVLHMTQAGWQLAGVVVALVLVAWAVFRRRDVA
ncbi:ABC transporter permease subunit [Cellulomonas sp. PhB150]|uniref:ABC transporter permease subunit n=1 Tax=Cellulomonas sp. PhB150 TaxID=2485188 RepID=UPI000F47B5D4|nr:ABC transporter permease subunit [Cellulomonas sp. PhB150]ROS27753.1 ABC-2 type transport system permease protein [Cellulomonas sp. PhB150]